MVARGREKQWITFINPCSKAFKAIGDWKEATNNEVRWCEAVISGAELFMREWREKNIAMAEARHVEEAATEAEWWHIQLHHLVTARKAMAFREGFNGPARVLVLPPPPRSATAKTRTRGLKPERKQDWP